MKFIFSERLKMELVKPEWHRGDWTDEQQESLIEELEDAEKDRSLTKEEKEWLELISTCDLDDLLE